MTFPRIPIINYHKVTPTRDIGITARHPEKFAADMQTLFEGGYETITFAELFAGKILPAQAVIITFDDGYASVYEYALPVMKKFAFRGVVFMPAAFINRYNDWDVQFANKKFRHLSLGELQALQHSGFEIGSHGLRHLALNSADPQNSKEISESKYELEKILGTKIVSFCYPFGRFNELTMKAVAAAGYRVAVASIHYRHLANGFETFALRRFNIYSMDSRRTFFNKLKMDFNSPLAYRDYLIQLGGRATVLYQKIKKGI